MTTRETQIESVATRSLTALAFALLVALCWMSTLVAPPAARASEATLVNVYGRGWGHGIGMSQFGAYGYARHGWTYKAILRHYYTGIRFGTVANSYVRVQLASGAARVRVTSAAPFKASDGKVTASIPGGVEAVLTWANGYSLAAGEKTWTFKAPVTFTPGARLLRLMNRNANGWPKGDGGARYRGTLRAIHSTSGFAIVDRLRLEPYLCGVVPRESPSSWPQAALRAQAVAARSYAVRSIKGTGDFDVYCTTASQVYNGYEGEAASTNRAVAATRGIVPTYAGRPITAYFFSTSGGRTENIENVWGGSPVPYLKGVSDPYDTASPYHIWPDAPLQWTGAQITARLGAFSASNLSGVRGTFRTIYVTRRGVSPRVVRAYVIGVDATNQHASSPASGWTLRGKLGLRDTWFTVRTLSVTPAAADDTRIVYGERVTLSGRTYPTIGADKRVKLFYYRDGAWTSLSVAKVNMAWKTFTITDGGTTRTARYVTYAFRAAPPRTTTYYFAYGRSTSPRTTIKVAPAVSLTAEPSTVTAGQTVTLRGLVRPRSKAGSDVKLQYLDGSHWTDVGSTTIASDGSYAFAWVAVEGTYTFRALVLAGDQLSEGWSLPVTVGVTPAS
jgi:peptidoglycan hydrolase-like amidase